MKINKKTTNYYSEFYCKLSQGNFEVPTTKNSKSDKNDKEYKFLHDELYGKINFVVSTLK